MALAIYRQTIVVLKRLGLGIFLTIYLLEIGGGGVFSRKMAVIMKVLWKRVLLLLGFWLGGFLLNLEGLSKG